MAELIPGVDYEVAVCDNCGLVDHTPTELAVCIDSMLGPPQEDECPAGGPHTPTNASSHPDRMFDPYWHCDECGASLPTPEKEY